MKKLFLVLLLPLFLSCSDNDDEYIDVPIDYKVPSNFPPLAYDIESNPITQKGFELGKKLFYDGRLSSDGTISCGFCHEQKHAFTHHGHAVSQGVNGQTGTRNSPSIQNLAYQTSFMYDGATEHLNLQPIIPITNPIEMDGNFNEIVAMMNADSEYRKLFGQAFPGKPIAGSII